QYMSAESVERPFWLVGASFDGRHNQLERFVRDGIWETDTPDVTRQENVKQVQPGERLVVKSTYVRKHGLPFDARGNFVSTMGIKAIGTVLENMGDGFRLRVRWDEVYDEPREWYFYTFRWLISRVEQNDYFNKALHRFVFEKEEQDYDYFLNYPYWRDRMMNDDG